MTISCKAFYLTAILWITDHINKLNPAWKTVPAVAQVYRSQPPQESHCIIFHMSTHTRMQSTVEKVVKPIKCAIIIQNYKLTMLCTLVVFHYHQNFKIIST